MRDRIKEISISILFLSISIILQSTIINMISINGIKPDFSLIVLVFISYRKGCMVGQVSGFISGLLEDFISLTPIGFSSLIKAIIGFLYGLIQGSFIIDRIFIPMLFILIATILKGIFSSLIATIFSLDYIVINIFHYNTLIRIVYNAVLAPLIFFLLNILRIFKISEKEKLS